MSGAQKQGKKTAEERDFQADMKASKRARSGEGRCRFFGGGNFRPGVCRTTDRLWEENGGLGNEGGTEMRRSVKSIEKQHGSQGKAKKQNAQTNHPRERRPRGNKSSGGGVVASKPPDRACH